MAKLHDMGEQTHPERGKGRWLWFFCPGCKYGHTFEVPHWEWSGDMDKPTFSPSLLINGHVAEKRCHLFVKNGKIEFLDDCFHDLKGQTVEMIEET